MITGFRLRNGLFLQSDILLTSPKNSKHNDAEFPTYHNYESGEFPLLNNRIFGLAQKTLIINDRFAIAFAGRVDRINMAVHLIKKLTLDDPNLTSDRYMSALNLDPELTDGNLCAIFLAPEGDEFRITHYGEAKSLSNLNFYIVAGGTGAQQAIEHYSQYPLEAFEVADEDIVAHGTCMALEQFARHLIDEIDNQEFAKSIGELFGGGFEVAAFYDGKIKKVTDIVYAFAEAEFDDNMVLHVDPPNFLMKSTYEGDNLIIRSLANEVDPLDGYHKTFHDRTFTIPPITRLQEGTVEAGSQRVHFLGEFLCFIIKVKHAGHHSFTIPFIRKYDSYKDFITKGFLPLPLAGHISFKYSEIFQSEIHERITRYMTMLEEFGKPLE